MSRSPTLIHTVMVLSTLILGACAGTPVPPERPAAPAPALTDLPLPINQRRPFAVRIVPSAPQPMVEGEAARFHLTSERTGFAQVHLLRASGTVLVLAENLPIKGLIPRWFPSAADGFDLTARAPAGIDTALLVVTAVPFTTGLGTATVQRRPGPVRSPLNAAAFLDRLNRGLQDLHPDQWNSASAPVEVLVRQ